MANIETLIALLADGRCYSGELLGEHLGVSRTAVWKQLKKLSDLGLSVESVKGKGYQLSSALELLDRERVYSYLSSFALSQLAELDIEFIVDSTNAQALKKIPTLDDDKAYVCMAEYQSQGRGRRGRQWLSPLGSNLSLSFGCQLQMGAAALDGLSLAVGVQVVDVLESLGFEGVSLKWPNDILVNNKKLGGILLEMTGDPAGLCYLVIGIGINVHMTETSDEIGQEWTSMAIESHKPISRNQLAAGIISHILPMLSTYAEKGFGFYAKRWRDLDGFAGQVVKVIAGNTSTQGIARGVTDAGALLLECEGEYKTFYGGEISLRMDTTAT